LLNADISALFQAELLEPAVQGTLNVLRAAKGCGIGRVVLMSSQAAMVPNPNWPADKVIDEDCWADVELLKKVQVQIKAPILRFVVCAMVEACANSIL
jgi:nucleoside-diphosphate-sugar epimerase